MTQHVARPVSRQQGFTLIELLIVIVVIGILAGIAILAFGPFQQSAAEACDRANARIEAGADAAVEAAAIMELAGLDSVDDFLDPRGGTLDCAFIAGAGG